MWVPAAIGFPARSPMAPHLDAHLGLELALATEQHPDEVERAPGRNRPRPPRPRPHCRPAQACGPGAICVAGPPTVTSKGLARRWFNAGVPQPAQIRAAQPAVWSTPLHVVERGTRSPTRSAPATYAASKTTPAPPAPTYPEAGAASAAVQRDEQAVRAACAWGRPSNLSGCRTRAKPPSDQRSGPTRQSAGQSLMVRDAMHQRLQLGSGRPGLRTGTRFRVRSAPAPPPPFAAGQVRPDQPGRPPVGPLTARAPERTELSRARSTASRLSSSQPAKAFTSKQPAREQSSRPTGSPTPTTAVLYSCTNEPTSSRRLRRTPRAG